LKQKLTASFSSGSELLNLISSDVKIRNGGTGSEETFDDLLGEADFDLTEAINTQQTQKFDLKLSPAGTVQFEVTVTYPKEPIRLVATTSTYGIYYILSPDGTCKRYAKSNSLHFPLVLDGTWNISKGSGFDNKSLPDCDIVKIELKSTRQDSVDAYSGYILQQQLFPENSNGNPTKTKEEIHFRPGLLDPTAVIAHYNRKYVRLPVDAAEPFDITLACYKQMRFSGVSKDSSYVLVLSPNGSFTLDEDHTKSAIHNSLDIKTAKSAGKWELHSVTDKVRLQMAFDREEYLKDAKMMVQKMIVTLDESIANPVMVKFESGFQGLPYEHGLSYNSE
jgi:hypothetical protein